MSTGELSREHLDLLRQYDTPTICNVIELFALRACDTGYMDHRIRSCFPEMPPMVGHAATVTLRTAAPAPTRDGYASMEAQVQSFDQMPGPPVVVLQDLDSPSAAATFGEVMCSTYQRFGAVGLITSGPARDLDQVRELGFPAFSDGAICSHGYFHFLDLQVPVHVGGITVFPNDLLHGDCNGVTTIPREIAADVAQAAADYMAAEEVVLNYLRSDRVTPAGLAEAQAECRRLIAALAGRVQKKQK